VCVCECELDAAGAAPSQIDKHNMRYYSMPSKRLVAEMRADGRDVSLKKLDATGVALSQIDKRSPCDVISESHNMRWQTA
jgi:hypothetical protein